MSGTAEQIALVIGTRAATGSIAGGFETEIGSKVFRGRRNIGAGQVPCTVIVEAEDRVLDTSGKKVRLKQRYIIESHDVCTADHPNDKAHCMLRDMKRAQFGGDKTLGGVAKDLFYVGRGIAARDDGLLMVSAVMEIDVEYVEELLAP